MISYHRGQKTWMFITQPAGLIGIAASVAAFSTEQGKKCGHMGKLGFVHSGSNNPDQ